MLNISDLGIFGGEPAFKEPLHVGRPNIGNRRAFEERLNDILDRKWLTNDGRYVQEFEKRIAELVNVEHCVAMCNATVALEIGIRALGMAGEVIVPSFTFIATAHALQWQEITPIFCDIDPGSHTLDASRIESLITPRTSGIIGVHVWGRPCAVEELGEIAERRGLKLMFDAAHALGCTHQGRMIGGFGHAEVFSFHATKFLNSLEGGALVTNDAELARRVRLMKNFGFSHYDQTDYIGINGKMDEVSAAMGLTNLESMDEFVTVNRRNYYQYREELGSLPGIKVLPYNESERTNYQYLVVEVDQAQSLLSRDQILQLLHRENVLARRYFYPGCHRMEPYRSCYPHAGLLLPETEELVNKVLVLPQGTGVASEDIGRVCEIIGFALNQAGEIISRLES